PISRIEADHRHARGKRGRGREPAEDVDLGGASRDDGFNTQAPAEPIQALDIEIPRARRRDEGEGVYERPSYASCRSIAAVDFHGVVTESQGLDESLSEIALDRSDQE